MNNMKEQFQYVITTWFLFTCTVYLGVGQTPIDTVYVKTMYATTNTIKDSASYYRIRTRANGVLKAKDYNIKDSVLQVLLIINPLILM